MQAGGRNDARKILLRVRPFCRVVKVSLAVNVSAVWYELGAKSVLGFHDDIQKEKHSRTIRRSQGAPW